MHENVDRIAIAVVPLVPHEELAAPHFPGARDGAVHDVDGFLGRRGLDEPAAVFLGSVPVGGEILR